MGNNAFLVREGRVADDEALRDINRKIVQLGEELGMPVVATGDVHFLDPHNAINSARSFRRRTGFEDADNAAAAVLQDDATRCWRNSAYLGAEKCHEVVIDNPAKIAAIRWTSCGLFPKHPKGKDTFQPFWADAADNIQNLCVEQIGEGTLRR